MKSIRPATAVAALLATAVLPALAAAQDLHPSRRPSPMAMARTALEDGTYVRVVYSRPYLRGRDNIFGTKESEALVPFGEIWRFAANEATEITVTGDVTVGGEELPAGTYSVFVTPGEKEWTFHFNSALGLNGTSARNPETGDFEKAYKAENDAATVKAAVAHLGADDEEVDQLTISFEEVEGGAHMIVRWQKTEVRLAFASAG
jgi:hypothetical protein